MRIPFTKYGWPQVVVYPALIIAAMIFIALSTTMLFSLRIVFVLEFIFALLLIWSFSFFRDPYRESPRDENLLLSPADGLVTEIEIVERNDLNGKMDYALACINARY